MSNKVTKKTICFLLSCSFLLSCKPAGTAISIDNPLPEAILVKLDQKESLVLPPSQLLEIELSTGSHSFESYHIDSSLIDRGTFVVSQSSGLVNVTRTDYVLWKIVFADKYLSGSSYPNVVTDDTFEIQGKKYWGPFTHYPARQVFIPTEWDVDVLKTAPDSVQIPKDKQYVLVKKLYRAADFTKEYHRFYVRNEQKIEEYLQKN